MVFENDSVNGDEIIMAPYSLRKETYETENVKSETQIKKFQSQSKGKTVIMDNNVTIMEYNIKDYKPGNNISWDKKSK